MCVCFSFNGAYRAVNRGIFFVLTVTVSENWDARCSLHLHKTFNIYTEFREDDDRKISNRFSQTSSFVSYVFGGFAKETPKKDGPSLGSPWVQERLCREASSRRTILHQLCMGQGRKQPAYFEGSFLLRGERLFLFFLGGGAEDNKKRETGDTHNFVMGSVQRKIGNCEFQWFETRRVINQRSAPNVWIKCCLLAFSFKRGIFFEGNGVSPNPWPLERFRNLDEQFHFGAFISIVGEGSYPLSETDTCPIKRKRKIFLTQMCLFAYLLSVPLGG